MFIRLATVLAIVCLTAYILRRLMKSEAKPVSPEERLHALITSLDAPEGEKMHVLFQIWKAHRELATKKPLSDYLAPEVVVKLVKQEGQRHCAVIMDDMMEQCSLESFDDYEHWLSRALCPDENSAWCYVHDDFGDDCQADRYETLADDSTDYLAGMEYEIKFDALVLKARETVLSEVAKAAMDEYLNGDRSKGHYALKECLEQMECIGMLAQTELAEDGRNLVAIYEESRLRRAALVMAEINARSLPNDERRRKINAMLSHFDVSEQEAFEFSGSPAADD